MGEQACYYSCCGFYSCCCYCCHRHRWEPDVEEVGRKIDVVGSVQTKVVMEERGKSYTSLGVVVVEEVEDEEDAGDYYYY